MINIEKQLHKLVGQWIQFRVDRVTPESLHSDRIGQVVLVRSLGSGVWMGRLVARMTSTAGHSVSLQDARRLWEWTGAGECTTLAIQGPLNGRIGPIGAPIVHEVVEEHVCTPEAVAALERVAVWTGR